MIYSIWMSAFVLSALVITDLNALNPIVLRPVKTTGVEAALLIVPGANITGQAYQPLAQEIQQGSDLKLWVVLLTGWLGNFPNPLEMGSAVSGAQSALKSQGMTSNNYFLAGHSLGGVFVGQYAQSNANKFSGVLLFASYLTKNAPLATYPLPVLHISGDLDGQTRITRIADTFEQLENNLKTNQQAKFKTPVVVMQGVTHAQFASGTMPPAVANKDLKPEVNSQTAYGLIAKHSNAFMAHALSQVDSGTIQQAESVLSAAYQSTLSIMTPLLNLKGLDVNPQHRDMWGNSVQYAEATLSSSKIKVTSYISDNIESFLEAKPTITLSGPIPEVTTFAHIVMETNLMDISTTPSAPKQIELKVKTFQALQETTNLMPRNNDKNLTCKDFNKMAFAKAKLMASPLANKRFSDHGRPLTFGDDVMYSNGLQWSISSINLHETNGGLHVTSTGMKTGTHQSFISMFNGMHYCKLLSPYRAAEWMYVDSLRTHK